MMALLSLLAGFLSPFIPDLIKIFRAKQDYAHELAMRELDRQIQREVGIIDMNKTLAASDVQDAISARQMGPVYGLKLLDALDKEKGWFMKMIKGGLIWALSIIEVMNGLIRPSIAYLVVGLWVALKLSQAYFAYKAGFDGSALDAAAVAMTTIWSDHDFLMLEYVMGFFFGARHRMKTI